MDLPERIFAIGGAGKAITLTLLESDWIVDGILKPRPNPKTLTVTIIDTAEGEQNSDIQRIREIRAQISDRESELRDPDKGRTGSIDVEYKLITEDIYLSGSIDLLGDDAVPRIAAGNGMDEDNWWIKERHINENLDFAKGVVRKRGLGKAIYYKAYAEDDEISSYIDLPQKGKVAIIVGLGGGTGSGILLDLAKHIQERQRTAEITLFGILPNHTEGIKENTNAYAALSELEYSAICGDQVFKNQVLIPIDPTNFDGKTGNTIQTEQFLEELDEAVVYLIASYYNTEGLEDPFADTPQYAPFTIGIPQILRYNVEAVNNARDRFRSILDERDEALRTEKNIYDRVDRFIGRYYNAPEPNVRNKLRDLDVTDLQERLNRRKSWLDVEIFRELEYRSIDVFEEMITEGENQAEDIAEQIDIISGSLRAIDPTDDAGRTFVDTMDEHLAQVLEKEFRTLQRRKEILAMRQEIDDSRIQDAIEYLIDIGDTSAAPGVKLSRLESELEGARDEFDKLSTELEETIDELEQTRDEQSEEIERRTTDWIQSIRGDVQTLQETDMEQISNILSELEASLEQYMRSVTNTATEAEVDQINEAEVRETLDELSRELDPLGVDTSSIRNDISGSLTELKRAKIAFLTLEKEPGTLEDIVPWKGDTAEEKEEANRDYRIQKNNLNDGGIFQVGPPTGNFSAELTFETESIRTRAQETRQDLAESVVHELNDRVEEFADQYRRSLDSTLNEANPDTAQLRETAQRVFRTEVGETEEIESRKDELEAKIGQVESRIELYEPMIDLFQTVSAERETWSEKSSSFKTELIRQDRSEEQDQLSNQDDEYIYVKNIQPNNIFRATGKETIAETDLFSSDEENQRLRSNLEEFAKNARNQEYNGLYRRKLAKDQSRYDDLKIRVAALSPAINHIDSETLDFEEMFQDAFDLGASGRRVTSPFTSWRSETGGRWDIGVSVFVTGVFLDNIRKVVQADGYHTGYQQRDNELGDDILIHHSHLLQDGQYVRRNTLLNMEDEDDIDFFLRDESEIIDELLEHHIDITDR